MDVADPRADDPARTDDQAWADEARHSDREHMATTFAPRDIQDLHGEINVLRYLPLPVMIRAADGASTAALSRVLHAAATAAASVELTVATSELAAAADLEEYVQRDIH